MLATEPITAGIHLVCDWLEAHPELSGRIAAAVVFDEQPTVVFRDCRAVWMQTEGTALKVEDLGTQASVSRGGILFVAYR
jgi:hypothetical protein